MTDRITKGTITADVLHAGRTVLLKTATDAIAIERADLGDAIFALCALQQSLDPEGYLALAEQLIPHSAIIGPTVTVRDVLKNAIEYSGSVSAEGRTSVVLDDEETDFVIGDPPVDGWKHFVPDPPMAEQIKPKK